MNQFAIITDSASDLGQQMVDKMDISVLPLHFMMQNVDRADWPDHREMSLRTFYDLLRSGERATTSALNANDYIEAMTPILEAGQDILVIAFSSGLSTTYQSAVIAAKELREVYPDRTIHVVDTLCAALGQGLLVWHASRKQAAGMGLEELVAWVEANKLNICHWVTVDDLSHLKRGGRISATTAIVGTMLNIKPIIYVDNDGHLINTAKVRGRKTAMDYLAKKLGETCTDLDTVFIAHGDCAEDAAALEAIVKEKYGVRNVITGYVGPVIGAHTGPGVLVLFFMGSHR